MIKLRNIIIILRTMLFTLIFMIQNYIYLKRFFIITHIVIHIIKMFYFFKIV